MNDTNLQEVYEKLGADSLWTAFANKLAHFGIVDVGIIESIEDTIATVRTYYVQGDSVKYVRAEIMMIGNLEGQLSAIDSGQPCLIIYPRSPSASLKDTTVDITYGLYDEQAAKCIPLTTYNKAQLVTLSNSSDGIVLASDLYASIFSSEKHQFMSDKLLTELNATEGSASLISNTSIVQLQSDGSIESEQGRVYDVQNKVFNWKSKIIQDSQGAVNIQAAGSINSSSHESFGQTQLNLAADGSMALKTGIDEQDKFKSLISIDTSGNITIASYASGSVKSQIQVKSDGSITIANEGQYSIAGKNGVVIDGQSGKVSIKNSNANLYTILNGMLQILNSSLVTQGSPGGHTVIPNQFQQQAQQLGQLME